MFTVNADQNCDQVMHILPQQAVCGPVVQSFLLLQTIQQLKFANKYEYCLQMNTSGNN